MIKSHAIFPQIMLLCVCFQFVRCRSALFLFREDEGVVPIDGHKISRHDAPDDGLTEDDRIVPKLRDEQHDEDDLAHQLDDAGEERQNLVAKALQGVAGGEQDAQHRVERCVPEQIAGTVFEHDGLTGAGDEGHHPRRCHPHQQNRSHGHDDRVEVDLLHPLADAVRLARAAVLRNEGRTRRCHAQQRHIGEHEHLAGGGVPGDDQCAQPIDAILQNDRARRDDAAHQAHADALAEQLPVQMPADLEVLFLREEQLDFGEHIHDAEQDRHALGDDRSHRCALHPHPHPGDEEQVQQDVQARREEQEDQRHKTVADGAEQTGAEVVGKHDEDAVVDDDDVPVGVFEDLRRSVQQHQQRAQTHRTGQRDAERGNEADDKGACHRLLEQIVILRPVGARCDDGKAVADAEAKAHQKLVDRAAGANGGQCRVAQHIAHDHGVHRVVELLEQVRDEDGQHEDDQALENGAVHQVYVHRKWGSFCGLGHAVPPIRPENDPLRLEQRGPF